jgi:hypothetical protein
MRSTLLALLLIVLAAPRQTKAQTKPQTKPSPYRIAGTLHNAATGDLLHQARLIASTFDDRRCPGTRVSSADADANPDGTFTLTVPCAATWRFTVEATGFPTQAYQQHGTLTTGIVLTAAAPAIELSVSVVPNASLSGFILDETGEPVRDARASLLDANPPAGGASQQARPVASASADDRGFYEFPKLLPGSYVVAVQAQPWYAVAAARVTSSAADPSLDLTYPLTFYPGVADPQSSTVLHLAPGATQQADIHLTPVPAIHLTVPIPGGNNIASFVNGIVRYNTPQNRPNIPGIGPTIQQETPFGTIPFQPGAVTANPDGSLDIAGLAPGTYSLLERHDRFEPTAHPFSIAKDSAHAIPIDPHVPTPPPNRASAANARLTGFVLAGTAPSSGTMLLLVAATPTDSGTLSIRCQQSNTDGSFAFDKLPLGNYILVALDDAWSKNWSDPATVATWLAHGTPIQLTASKALAQPLQPQSTN